MVDTGRVSESLYVDYYALSENEILYEIILFCYTLLMLVRELQHQNLATLRSVKYWLSIKIFIFYESRVIKFRPSKAG